MTNPDATPTPPTAPPRDFPNGVERVMGPWGEELACARCGGSVESVACYYCGGAGFSHHDCGEDTCACLHPEDNVTCAECGGSRYSAHCTNTPDWCEAHPLPGREHVTSTSLSNAAWRDVHGY